MGGEWEEATLGDLITLQRGHDLPESKRMKGEVPILGSFGVTGWHNESKAKGPGVTVGRSGASFGVVAYSETDYWPLNTALYVKDFHGNDPKYVHYFLKTVDFKSYNSGSAQPSLNRNHIHPIPISIPNLSEQKAIAHILGTLDDKIELNRQMNATLESMAQALFKSWFVDSDPVIDNALAAGNPIPEPLQGRAESRKRLGDKATPLPESIRNQFPDSYVFTEELGWVPEGWGPVRLGDYVTVKRGGSPRPIHDFLAEKGLPWVKISDATSSNSRFLMETKQFIKPEGLSKTVKLPQGSLILSNSATPGVPMFLNLEACIHDGWLYFPEKEMFGDNYLYQLFLTVRESLLNQGNGSIFTNLKTDILKNQPVVRPNESLFQFADTRFGELKQRMLLIQEQTSSLSSLRNTLLPRLLSGELRIPDAEALVASAT